MKICSVEDCNLPVTKREWCNRHYIRFRRHGSPLLGAPLRQLHLGADCQAEGCYRPILAKGMCSVHYARWNAHGTLERVGTLPGAAKKFFHEIVLAYDGDDCLIWPFANIKGYAQIRINGRTSLVTRLVCEAEHGPAPTDSLDAAHSCGKGHLGCVTKRHLSWKTRLENMADAIAHGTMTRRQKLTRGEGTLMFEIDPDAEEMD